MVKSVEAAWARLYDSATLTAIDASHRPELGHRLEWPDQHASIQDYTPRFKS